MHYRALIRLKLYIKFKFINKRHQGFMKKIENRLRHTVIIGFLGKRHIFEDRAKLILYDVFRQLAFTFQFTYLMGELFHLVTFMQRKFQNRFLFKEAKVETMHLCWAKRLRDMKDLASRKNNPRMLKLCKSIQAIDPKIKNYVLTKFMNQVEKLQWICLYNIRKQERPDVCDEEEINLQTARIQQWLKEQFRDAKKTELLSAETKKEGKITEQDLIDFQLDDDSTKDNPAFINEFTDICWVDPFAIDPAKPKLKNKKKQKLASKLME